MVKLGNTDCQQYVVRDITKRKQIEAEREQLIAELDAFAHTVAHDLRAPLTIILGFSTLLAEEFDTIPITQVKKNLSLIEQVSHQMSSIIDELLLLASIRNMSEIPIAPLPMEPIVNEALHRFSFLLETHGGKIILTTDDWPMSQGYAPWIEEVWVNYISNAIKYGGQIPIVELGADVGPEGMVRYWVKDNGLGVPPEKLPLLFTQFKRLGDTRVKGYGLGLSIVQRIVHRLGGEVGVESHVGQGSVFSFTLPKVE